MITALTEEIEGKWRKNLIHNRIEKQKTICGAPQKMLKEYNYYKYNNRIKSVILVIFCEELCQII